MLKENLSEHTTATNFKREMIPTFSIPRVSFLVSVCLFVSQDPMAPETLLGGLRQDKLRILCPASIGSALQLQLQRVSPSVQSGVDSSRSEKPSSSRSDKFERASTCRSLPSTRAVESVGKQSLACRLHIQVQRDGQTWKHTAS